MTGGPVPRRLRGGAPYVVVHPGAAARRWPEDHHAAAVELLAGTGWRVVVTGGPGEEDLTVRVAGTAGTDLGGRTGPAELADADVDVVVLQRPEEFALVRDWLGREPGRDVPCVYLEHNPRYLLDQAR